MKFTFTTIPGSFIKNFNLYLRNLFSFVFLYYFLFFVFKSYIMLDHKLTVFYHLAKTPNTTRVAEELLLTQPAVSKSIRELEKELGITLFKREKGRLHLTESGKYLLAETEQLLKKERAILFEIGKMRNDFTGILQIGASTTLAQYILPEMLARFTQTYPQVKIHVASGNTDQMEREVLADNLHLAFIEGTPTQPDLHYIPFLKDEIVLVCANKNPIPEIISKDRLRELGFVFREKGSGTYHIIKKHLAEIGIPIHQLQDQLILGSTEGIKEYLQYSDCFALLSIYSIRKELAAGSLKVVEIEGLNIERLFYAIHRQGEIDPYAQSFLRFALK